MNACQTRIWNFDLPPYPREGLFHLDMSEHCQVNRLLKWHASRLACMSQLDVIEDLSSLRKFQRKLRARLWKTLGVRYDHSLPLDVTTYGTIQKEGFRVTKLIYQSRPGIYVTGLLYEPEGEGTFPAVLQMHGHNPDGKFGHNPQFTSMELAKSGYVCLTVDAIGTYERAYTPYSTERHGGFLGAAVFNIGETLMGQQVVDNMRGVDFLQSLPNVQKDRIGATGASGGGNQTMWLSAMDERIAASMPIVSVGSFYSYVYGMNCICELLPDGLTFTEEAGILALIAPRPLRIGNALYDCNHDFSVAEMLKTYHPVEQIYWKLGLPQNIAYSVADRVHGMSDRQREAILGHFAQFLKGEGNGNPLPLPECEVIPEEELRLFNPPQSRPAKVADLPGICRREGERLRGELLARTDFIGSKERRELAKLLRLQKQAARTKLFRYQAVNGVGRFALDTGEHLIPFLVKEGTVPGKYCLVLHPESKAELDEKTLEKAGADGATLVMPDLFGTGETAQPNHCIGLHHQFFRQLLWIGRSLIGEWVYDVIALEKMLKREFKAKQVTVYGVKECGACAVFAATQDSEIGVVRTLDAPVSLLFDHQTISLQGNSPFDKFLPGAIYSLVLSIPGFLKWGDISLAVALASCPVEYESARLSDGTKLSASEKTAFDREVASLRSRIR